MGKPSQAGALIRTRPTIATERGTRPAQITTRRRPAQRCGRTGLPVSRRGLPPPRMGPVAGARPNHQSDEDDADRLLGFGQRRRVHAVGWPLRMHPEQSPADPGLPRHAPPPPGAGVNTATGTSARPGTWWEHLRERPATARPRGADHGART
jgi:hypothetical protein